MSEIIAIAGSPSHPSRTYSVLEYAKHQLEAAQVGTELISVRDIPAEVLLWAKFDDPVLKQVVTKVEQAQAVILATPVYKASYTGVLKSFLDLLPQSGLAGKVILPIATGGTLAHLLAIDYALKPVLSTLGARYILGGVYIVDSQIQRLDNGGIQLDAEVEQRLQAALNELTGAIAQTTAKIPALSKLCQSFDKALTK